MKGIFKMDYSNGITVFIGNEGFYAEGELRDRAITLPVSGSELQGFLEGNGLVTPMHEETYIADFLDEVTLLDDGFIDPIGSSPDLNKHSLNELKELIGEEYDRQNDKGFFEEEQVGLSDLMGTLRDAAEHKHDTRDNTHSHDIDAR